MRYKATIINIKTVIEQKFTKTKPEFNENATREVKMERTLIIRYMQQQLV